jgi:hypothetical protein
LGQTSLCAGIVGAGQGGAQRVDGVRQPQRQLSKGAEPQVALAPANAAVSVPIVGAGTKLAQGRVERERRGEQVVGTLEQLPRGGPAYYAVVVAVAAMRIRRRAVVGRVCAWVRLEVGQRFSRDRDGSVRGADRGVRKNTAKTRPARILVDRFARIPARTRPLRTVQ